MANIYVVSTPIGNLKDITLRAIETLKSSELIVCEDTRVSGTLLAHFGIKSKLTSLNEFNEEVKSHQILNQIEKLENVSLISDAGTPLLSDPGYKFIKRAGELGHKIIPIPGASALLSALVVSSLPTNAFTYLGFLPKSSSKQIKIFEQYKNQNHTLIIFESPHRVIKTLQTIQSVFGDINMSICRELTKKFEQISNLPISTHMGKFETKKPKGEFTLVLNPKEN